MKPSKHTGMFTMISISIEDKIDLQRSVRLARRLTTRPAREDLVQRGILSSLPYFLLML